MLRISWTEHKSNEDVLRITGTEEKLGTIRKIHLEFLGHALRKEGLEN